MEYSNADIFKDVLAGFKAKGISHKLEPAPESAPETKPVAYSKDEILDDVVSAIEAKRSRSPFKPSLPLDGLRTPTSADTHFKSKLGPGYCDGKALMYDVNRILAAKVGVRSFNKDFLWGVRDYIMEFGCGAPGHREAVNNILSQFRIQEPDNGW